MACDVAETVVAGPSSWLIALWAVVKDTPINNGSAIRDDDRGVYRKVGGAALRADLSDDRRNPIRIARIRPAGELTEVGQAVVRILSCVRSVDRPERVERFPPVRALQVTVEIDNQIEPMEISTALLKARGRRRHRRDGMETYLRAAELSGIPDRVRRD